jgi:hypothetical protein
MFRGYRFLITATCGLALFVALGTGVYFGSLYAPNHKQYEAITGKQAGQNDYQGPSESLPDISGLPGPVERAIANPHPNTGQDHEKRDLATQEASALWAFWMVVASFLSVLITTVGTIFLYKQIVLTREAVEDTGEATKAMRKGNEIAHAAQRPWLDVKIKMDGIAKSENGYTLRTILMVKNLGPTPGTHLRYAVDGFFGHQIILTSPIGFGSASADRDMKISVLVKRVEEANLSVKPDGLTIFPGGRARIYVEHEIPAPLREPESHLCAWLIVGLRYACGNSEGSTVRIFCIRSFGLPNETGFDFIGDEGMTFTETKAKVVPWESGGYAT